MNYIPGFSNYLQAAVPRYADGGAIMDAYQQAAVEPMTQEAVAPMSYEALADRRAAANTPPPGTSIVGPYAGDKGLSFGDDNTFDIYDEQEVRVVDGKGNVIFSGVGTEGANRAVAVAQSLSNDLGKNANFKIQKAERTISNGSVGPDRYIDVAYAAPSQSGLGFLADNVLPFAAAFIPGIGPIAGAALGSAVSSGLQGRSLQDALVRAAIAGGSAYAGGQVFGPATPAASAAPVDKIASAAIPPSAFDGILVNATRAVAPSLAGSAVGGALGSGLSSVTGFNPPPQNLAQQTPAIDYAGVEPIDVLATRLASGSGAPFAAAFPVPVNAMLSGALNTTQPAQQNKTAEDIEAERNPMVVTGNETYLSPEALAAIMATFGGGALTAAQPTLTQQAKTAEDIEAAKNPMVVTGMESLTPEEILLALGGVGGLAAATASGAGSNVVNGVDQVTGEIVANAPKSVTSPIDIPVTSILAQLPITGLPTADPALANNNKLTAKDIADYLRLASLGVSTASGLLGGDKGGGSGGTIPAGMGALSSLFSKQLPPSTLLGGAGGGALPASTLAAQGLRSPQNYYRYGYGPEQSFFDYATQGAPNTSRAYTGYEGTTAEDAFAPQPMRVATPPVALPQPITTPIPNNSAAPSMYLPDTTRFARGGFAVEGAGDGRDDKIPALLSDGEYVIDAETVALLGNGSNKAGAKLLDSFRVKVRKQKGKKLARGKFSDNAKRPEQYMAGGPA
jgi:hypothetical protein